MKTDKTTLSCTMRFSLSSPFLKSQNEGPEGVQWELGFAYFCTGKMRFGSLGLGITNTKLGMGNMPFHCTAYVINAQ